MLLHLVAAGTRMPGWVNADTGSMRTACRGRITEALTEIPLASVGRRRHARSRLEGETPARRRGPGRLRRRAAGARRVLEHRAAGRCSMSAPVKATRSRSASASRRARPDGCGRKVTDAMVAVVADTATQPGEGRCCRGSLPCREPDQGATVSPGLKGLPCRPTDSFGRPTGPVSFADAQAVDLSGFRVSQTQRAAAPDRHRARGAPSRG